MSVASKNPFDLLGNDDGDSDGAAAPVKTVDKTSTHTMKRNADGLAPASNAPVTTGSRRGGMGGGNDAAFRDRGAGSDRNRVRSTDDAPRGGAPRGGVNARVRGGRGGRFPRDRDDRHPKNFASGSEKQAAQSWGPTEGNAELKDEQAGEAIAQTEQKEAAAEVAQPVEPVEPEEPEDNTISLADYAAQQAEKKAAFEAENALKVRKANEGVKEDKKWAGAKELVKDNDEDYFAGVGGKAKRERERKVKQVVEIDQRYVEPPAPRGGRGGRGGARGDFRGDFRGGRGDSTRGEFRGGRGRGDGPRGRGDGPRGRGGPRGDFRGDSRGGRGGQNQAPQSLNPNDQTAFPSLGSN